MWTQTRGAQILPPVSAPAAPSQQVQHPETAELGTDGWPLGTALVLSSAPPLPTARIYCLEKPGQGDGGRGQSGHKKPGALLGLLWVEMAFLQAEKGRTKKKKKKTFGECLDLGCPWIWGQAEWDTRVLGSAQG